MQEIHPCCKSSVSFSFINMFCSLFFREILKNTHQAWKTFWLKQKKLYFCSAFNHLIDVLL